MQSDASLSLISQDSTSVRFSVTFTSHKNVNKYSLWCRLDALDSSGQRLGSGEASCGVWQDNYSQLSVPKPLVDGIASFKAYVWLFPDSETPVSNEVSL